eukprot:4226134-Amphidinium_carterae.1
MLMLAPTAVLLLEKWYPVAASVLELSLFIWSEETQLMRRSVISSSGVSRLAFIFDIWCVVVDGEVVKVEVGRMVDDVVVKDGDFAVVGASRGNLSSEESGDEDVVQTLGF